MLAGRDVRSRLGEHRRDRWHDGKVHKLECAASPAHSAAVVNLATAFDAAATTTDLLMVAA
jgi:hypothetical protein